MVTGKQPQQDCGTCHLKVVATGCRSSPQDQARQNPSIEKKGTHKGPPLAKTLLTTDGFWRERISFFKDMTPERLAVSRWPYTTHIPAVPSGFSGGNQTKQKMNLGENFGGWYGRGIGVK